MLSCLFFKFGVWTGFDSWMCVQSKGAIFEAFDESTGIVLQRRCPGRPVGARLHAWSWHTPIHVENLGPCVSYQPDHPLPSDRAHRAAAGHSQPAAACRDAAAHRRWLCSEHPENIQSLSFSYCTDSTVECSSRWLLSCSTEQPAPGVSALSKTVGF